PPGSLPLLEAAKLHFEVRAALESLRRPDLRLLAGAFRAAARQGLTAQLLGEIGEALTRTLRARARRGTPPGPYFTEIDPQSDGARSLSRYTLKLISKLERADETMQLDRK
ncbi:MAG TPA: hypothetical protein VF122_02100, partial [Caulobacteraceae bacterium]